MKEQKLEYVEVINKYSKALEEYDFETVFDILHNTINQDDDLYHALFDYSNFEGFSCSKVTCIDEVLDNGIEYGWKKYYGDEILEDIKFKDSFVKECKINSEYLKKEESDYDFALMFVLDKSNMFYDKKSNRVVLKEEGSVGKRYLTFHATGLGGEKYYYTPSNVKNHLQPIVMQEIKDHILTTNKRINKTRSEIAKLTEELNFDTLSLCQYVKNKLGGLSE